MPKKMQPAVLDLNFTVPAGAVSGDNRSYIDTAKQLSKVNRRLYSQARNYAYQGLTFIWRSTGTAPTDLATVTFSVATAGNTWITQNAHVKGEALWHQMQELVLEDNPSIAGKWHDYKIQMSNEQITARTLECRDGQGVAYPGGEWNISTYVMPQHEVDPATGLPLAAVEVSACLLGADTATKRCLTFAYQESRATVSPDQPNVPAGMSDSFFNLLTDSGSQEPELADVIELENDNPPYDIANYPGTTGNAVNPVMVQFGAISAAEVDGRVGGFIAPCGLIEITINGFDSLGAAIAVADMPEFDILLHVAPGNYKGVASVPMGQ
jgi:hypothetical protein